MIPCSPGWLAGGSLGYSHSMIFKAGAVICEIGRLASENLLIDGKQVKHDIKLHWQITCNA